MTDGIEQRRPDSHPDAEVIAYCPDCEAELSDFFFGTDDDAGGTPLGRCRDCYTPVWMSPEAAELVSSDYVTLEMYRSASSDTEHQEGDDA